MDANVRAAAAETLRLCREAGHDVSPAVAALHVQAQRLAKVHPNDLVAHCAAKLAAAGDPALETLKMQMDVESTRALRAHAAAETRRARETRAGALEREVADTVVDAATVSGRAERLLLDRLHARAFEYVFVSAGLEPLLLDPPDSAARDDAHAAFESVFPRHAARRFFALPSAERAAALRELASVVVGALAFEARRRDPPARYHDPFEEAEAEATGGEADDPFLTCSTQKDPLRALRDRAPAYAAANAATRRDVAARLASAERLCGQYAVVVEHLGASAVPSRSPQIRQLTDELNNRRAFADALARLLDECDRGAETANALARALEAETAATETALDNADARVPVGVSVRFQSETLVSDSTPFASGRGARVTGASGAWNDPPAAGVPASVAFPALDAIGALHGAITEEIELLNDARAVFATLTRHAKPFATSLTNGMLHAATEARRRAEARETPMAQPEFEHDRHTPDRVYDDDLCRAMAIKSAAEIVPGDTLAFSALALRGYDAHAAVKRGGLLRRARVGGDGAARTVWGDRAHDPENNPEAVAMTGVIFEGEAYGFADEDGALQFASQPEAYLKKLRRVAATRPELVHAMALDEVVRVDAIVAETVADLASASLVRDLGLKPVLRADFGAQTPTHFVERRVDPDYEWNTWALRRRALRAANLRNKRTKGAQTGLSHFRRAGQTQTWAPKAGETQTVVEKATAMPKKVRYVGGLRGAPAEAKMHVVSLELDLGQPHEF
jgi:hypothetical protein